MWDVLPTVVAGHPTRNLVYSLWSRSDLSLSIADEGNTTESSLI